MTTSDAYREAARAYADGVRVLFAPSGQEAGERGSRGPVSFGDTADQAERLAPLSARLTEEAAAGLTDAAAAERMALETALRAKALTDLEISTYLLQAAQDEGTEAAFGGARTAERGATSLGSIEPYLKLLLEEEEPDPGREERRFRRPRNLDDARAELTLYARDALTLISERAAGTGRTALEGLAGVGTAGIGAAVELVGRDRDIAQALGLEEPVTRLFRLFRDFLRRAYDSLVALLGREVAAWAGDQVKEWVESLISGVAVDALLERLYQTAETRQALRTLIQTSNAEIDQYVAAIERVGDLNHAFRKQSGLADKILPRLKLLTLFPAGALPQGRLFLAATYALVGGYVILVGGDYVDARRLERLDRVPGVRQVVERNLAQGQGG